MEVTSVAKDGTNRGGRRLGTASVFAPEVNPLLPQKNYRKDFRSRQSAMTFLCWIPPNLKRLTYRRALFCKVWICRSPAKIGRASCRERV